MHFLYGYISEVDQATGLYRVNLEELEIVSPWMPALFMDTAETKDENSFVVNQHVACICDARIKTGVILGAIYDKKNPPAVGDKNKRVTTYPDDSYFSFDKSTGEWDVYTKGSSTITSDDLNKIYGTNGVELNGNSNGGLVKVNPLVNKINVLENDINNLKTLIAAWVIVPADGGAALKTILASWYGSPIVNTIVANLENQNAKH